MLATVRSKKWAAQRKGLRFPRTTKSCLYQIWGACPLDKELVQTSPPPKHSAGKHQDIGKGIQYDDIS